MLNDRHYRPRPMAGAAVDLRKNGNNGGVRFVLILIFPSLDSRFTLKRVRTRQRKMSLYDTQNDTTWYQKYENEK